MGSQAASQPRVLQPKLALRELQKDFRKAVQFGTALLRKLHQEGAENTFIRRPSDPAGPWLLRVKLPAEMQERFALAPEVLLMAVGETGVQARDIDRCRMELAGAGLRLDSDVIIAVDLQSGLYGRLQRLERRRQWIPWQPGRRGDDFVFPALFEQIVKQIGEKDIFEERDPVRGHQVIGRRDAIRELSTHLLSAKSVGVFGLRKVGKTTLVRAVTDRLDPAGSALSMLHSQTDIGSVEADDASEVTAIWVDCQRLLPRTVDRLAALLADQILLRQPALGAGPARSTKGPLEYLVSVLEQCVRADRVPIAIVLDEYDLLFEGHDGTGPISDLHQLFGVLRAFAQETSQLSITVIGRDPSHFRQPTWNGVPNPMLSWFIPQWIGPLDRRGADDLLSTLGRRVGLLVGKRTKEFAYTWTGGHPLLHRQYGAVLHRFVRAEGVQSEQVETDPFCEQVLDDFLERDAVIDICREIFELLTARYPKSSVLLEQLATSPLSLIGTLEGQGGLRSEAARELRQFGILLGPPAQPFMAEVLRWYAQNLHPSSTRHAAQ